MIKVSVPYVVVFGIEEYVEYFRSTVVVNLTYAPALPSELSVLMEIYNLNGGPSWTNPFPWNISTDPCKSAWVCFLLFFNSFLYLFFIRILIYLVWCAVLWRNRQNTSTMAGRV